MPTIELIDVTKTFNEGKVLAVDNITLKINDGEDDDGGRIEPNYRICDTRRHAF